MRFFRNKLRGDRKAVKGTTGGLQSTCGRDKILNKLILASEFRFVLDVGCGLGDLFYYMDSKAIEFEGVGVDVVEEEQLLFTGFEYLKSDFLNLHLDRKFDLVFSSHVIEHVPNTGDFLTKFFSFLKPGGYFCLIWPPPKEQVVGGHVHVFNMGLMLYNLVRMGVDCREVKMYRSGYNLAIIGRYCTFELPDLTFNRYELEALAPYFPCPVEHGFDGRLRRYVKKL